MEKGDEEMKILDIGCGNDKYREEGSIVFGIDKYKTDCVDKLWDGEKDKIPYPDNYFDKVVSFGALEHISNFKNVMEEIWRIVKPNGKVIIQVPNFNSLVAFSEEHKVFFTIDSFSYMEEGHYGNWIYDIRFKIIKNDYVFISNRKSKLRFLNLLNPVINFKPIKFVYTEMSKMMSMLIIPTFLRFELVKVVPNGKGG